MTSHRPPHREASSTDPTGSDTEKPHARSLSVDQSAPAVMKKPALSDLSETLMEQIVDMRNVEKAWRKVKANKGAPGPDGITLDTFLESFRDEWPANRATSCVRGTDGLESLGYTSSRATAARCGSVPRTWARSNFESES